MIGANNGVAANLKTLFPSMIATHCAAHRLNLAASNVTTNVSENIEDLAGRLFSFFARSSAPISRLSKTAEGLDVKFIRLACPARHTLAVDWHVP